MQSLEDQILGYVYVIRKKYRIDSISLAKLCYKMQRHVRAMKPAADILVAMGLLNARNQGSKVSYAISEEGIKYVENKGLIKIRKWATEE